MSMEPCAAWRLRRFEKFFAAKDPFDVMCQCGLLKYAASPLRVQEGFPLGSVRSIFSGIISYEILDRVTSESLIPTTEFHKLFIC